MAKEKTVDTSKVSMELEAVEQGGKMERGMSLKSLFGTETVKRRFQDVMGKKAAAFMSSVLSAQAMNPQLQACDPMSILSAALVAASMDLQVNPSLGFAHLVPYSGKAQFQIGWKGLVQLGQRTGQYLTMNVCEVHEGEIVKSNKFSGLMEFDEAKRISDKVVGYVFYFKLLNGFEKWTYMTTEQAEKHAKKYSKAYQKGFGPWKDNFDAMAMKTVVKAGLSKWGVMSVEMQKALQFDQAAVTEDEKPEYIDGTTTEYEQDKSGGQDIASSPTEPVEKHPEF